MVAEQYACLNEQLEPALAAAAGFKRVKAAELTERQKSLVEQIFETEINTVYTPQSVSSAEDFPLLANCTLNVFVRLAPSADSPQKPRYAVIPFGRSLERIFTLQAERGYAFILLEDAVRLFASRFFPGEGEVLECVAFRITRER